MKIMNMTSVGKDLTTLFGVGSLGQLSDAELLARFTAGRGDATSQAAFEVLVTRHGPMVLGVCRRVLGDPHAADDAYQATFLVLARKATSVRVENSLGRWLHGVGIRVARRARAVALAERARVRPLLGFDPLDEVTSTDPGRRGDLRTGIDEEIARLPVRYRAVVILFHLEGLTQEEVARRLRCPVGTVQSRLYRARERLRSGLSRRGLSPAAWGPASWAATTARVEVPPALAAATVAAVARVAGGGTLAGIVPAAVDVLMSGTLKDMLMIKGWLTGLMLVALGLSATGAVALVSAPGRGGDDKPRAQGARPTTDTLRNVAAVARSERSIADRFREIRAEYDSQVRALRQAVDQTKHQRDRNEIYQAMAPDEAAYTRRMVDLAVTDPKDPGARDALVWVLDKPGVMDVGPYGDEFARAAALLVRHHGDDPEAVRIGLSLDNLTTHHRDALLLGFYAAAQGREAQGLARLALAQYLEVKAQFAASRPAAQGKPRFRLQTLNDDGKLVWEEVTPFPEMSAYQLELSQYDPEAVRAEAERLYEEVIAEYGDILHRRVGDRGLEALLREPQPTSKGETLTDEQRGAIERHLARKRTLGEVAEDRLDNLRTLAVGKAAPEIDGVDFEGRPLKLSEYRGQVVVLVFWGSWCGPCMREIPHERELVERLQGKPFALLGVNCDQDKAAALKAMVSERITWPNWHDGAPGEGPITSRYRIRGFPTCLVLDADGNIRHKQALGTDLDQAVDTLLAELEAKETRK